MLPPPSPRPPGGIIHSYQKYDPKEFPPPNAPAPDAAGAAFDYMLTFGSMAGFTPEQLAAAIRLDPSMFPSLGPSLDSIIRRLLERKHQILATYETDSAAREAAARYRDAVEAGAPPEDLRERFERAAREEQIADLERLYLRLPDQSRFAARLVSIIHRLAQRYQIDELASRYAFTGRTPMTPDEALAIKEELEAIDRLLGQLREAMKNAQLAVIDLDELADFAESAELNDLRRLREQIEDYLRRHAETQGLELSREGYRLTPRAMRIFQARILDEIFSSLDPSRSGRHTGPIEGEGPVELGRTRPYEFGDSLASMDTVGSLVNAMIREAANPARAPGPGGPIPLRPEDILIHRTRNAPRCASVVCLDMSGSMRHDGQYINAKRMALALDGLIRRDFPGDYLGFVECYTFAKPRHVSEIPALMPKPVTIRRSSVRLRADMSDPRIAEHQVPHHFTNLQRGLAVARRLLAPQATPNRQIIMISDGLPTAHFEGEQLFMLYPPDPRTEEATMREARACAREGITINFFLLPSWWQSSEDIQFAHRLAQETRGRVFFTAGRELDRFVLWDYVSMRRRIIGQPA